MSSLHVFLLPLIGSLQYLSFFLVGRNRRLQRSHAFTVLSEAPYTSLNLLEALEERFQPAFFYAGAAKEEYLATDNAMRTREHGKWDGFYANECLADVKQSAWVPAGYMSYIRNLDDGPDFHKWQRGLTYSEEDLRVMLILMTENHLPDSEIYKLMKKRELWEL